MSEATHITLAGTGLHTGAPVRVTFRPIDGPTSFWIRGNRYPVGAARVSAQGRSTTLSWGNEAVRTVEHLAAALAACNAHEGIAIEIDGPEMPLLDGCANAYLVAIETLVGGASAARPRLEVVRRLEVAVHGSHYVFEPCQDHDAPEATGPTSVSVCASFEDPRLETVARWNGDRATFREHIARARTFAFEHEIMALLQAGQAAHIAPESAVVLTHDEPLFAGPAFTWDEPVRHKLLDLIGDLFVWGGPLRGHVHAVRPGHAATHEAMRTASQAGAIRKVHYAPLRGRTDARND